MRNVNMRFFAPDAAAVLPAPARCTPPKTAADEALAPSRDLPTTPRSGVAAKKLHHIHIQVT